MNANVPLCGNLWIFSLTELLIFSEFYLWPDSLESLLGIVIPGWNRFLVLLFCSYHVLYVANLFLVAWVEQMLYWSISFCFRQWLICFYLTLWLIHMDLSISFYLTLSHGSMRYRVADGSVLVKGFYPVFCLYSFHFSSCLWKFWKAFFLCRLCSWWGWKRLYCFKYWYWWNKSIGSHCIVYRFHWDY